MHDNDEIEDLFPKRICFSCVGEPYLSSEIEHSNEIGLCGYCATIGKSYSIDDFAERIETAFKDHFCRTSDQPDTMQWMLQSDKESSYQWYRSGEPVIEAIQSAADIPLVAAADLQAILENKYCDFELQQMSEETEFSSTTHYDEMGPSDQLWQEEWRKFDRSLKTEARFFSRIAVDHLASVFGGIDQLNTTDSRPLVVRAGPGFEINYLYRARVFQSEDLLREALSRPDIHLGSPPAKLASAGRMNALGISVFYGATEANVALAEARPPVGSKVTVAKFDIIRPLHLLDLTAIVNVKDGGSIFDHSLKGRLERVSFLRSLGILMTKPVMPNDEAFDYLATQAVADFLATENKPQLDGIIFHSVQANSGHNVVLFHKAAQVELLEFPDGTEIDVRFGDETDDGFETEFSVFESVPIFTPRPPEADDNDILLSDLRSEPSCYREGDLRESVLRVDAKSIVVNQVDWVEYNTTSYPVTRNRYVKREWKF